MSTNQTIRIEENEVPPCIKEAESAKNLELDKPEETKDAESVKELAKPEETKDTELVKEKEMVTKGKEIVINVIASEKRSQSSTLRNLDWYSIFFPNEEQYQEYLNNDYVLAKRESHTRLFCLCHFLAFILSSIIVALVFILGPFVSKKLTLFSHPSNDEIKIGFPMQHLAIIYKNGTMFDLSLNEELSPSRGHLASLPKSNRYHSVFLRDGSFLLIDASLERPVMTLSRHQTIAKFPNKNTKTLSEGEYFRNSLVIGNNLWLFELTYGFDAGIGSPFVNQKKAY